MSLSKSDENIIRVSLIIVLAIVSVLSWINLFNLTPDSTNYISAAQNLIEKGELAINANWPPRNLIVGATPFTEYPPALPLLTAFFILLSGSALSGALITQTLGIIIFFYAVYVIIKELKLPFFYDLILIGLFTFFPAYRIILTTFWTEVWLLAFELLIVAHLIKMYNGSNRSFYILLILSFFATSFKFIAVVNIALYLVYYIFRRKEIKKLIFISITSILPVVIWFIRNLVLFGFTTRSHGNKVPGFEFLMVVYDKIALLAEYKFFLSIFAVPILLFIVVAPFINNREEIKRAVKENIKLDNLNFSYIIFFAGAAFYFIAIILFAIFTAIDPPDYRLLSVSITFAIPVFVLAFYVLFSDKGRIIHTSSKVILSVFLLLLIIFLKYPVKLFPVKINYPVEKELWTEIHADVENASHFYSEFEFKHQIFSEMPQLMLWRRSIDSAYVNELSQKGENPFFLFENSNEYNLKMKKMYRSSGFKKFNYSQFGYTLYIKD